MKNQKSGATTHHKTEQHKAEHRDAEDDVSIDFSGATSFFKKVDVNMVIAWAFVLFAVALVFSIRMLPAALPVTDDWADSSIRQNVRSQIAASVDQQFPNIPSANREELINKRTDELITQQQDAFDATKEQLSLQFKDQLRYAGEDSQQYTYLGDLDSYFWLRYTRNILRQGSTCDAVVNDQCKDMYVLAPLGTTGSFNPSFHVFAIFGLYKFITIFNGGYPLPATSFLLQALLGALTVIPAFFVGRRLAGNVGGLVAAVVISLHPLFLSRSLGSDSDLWIILLSLCVLWMTIEAIEAKTTRNSIIFTVLAAIFTAWLAASWEGWFFFYLVIFFGLIGAFLFKTAAAVFRQHERRPWHDKGVQKSAIILGVFYIAAFLFLAIAGKSGGYFRQPLNIVAASTGLDRAVVADYWPNVLTTVAELNKSSLAEAIGSMGGKLFFFIGLAGLMLLVLPRNTKWKIKHYLLFGGGLLVWLYLINTTTIGRFTAIALIAVPIAGALLMYLFDEEEIDLVPSLIVLVWFMAAIYATYSGVRFILLMIPAFGVVFAVTAGRTYEWLSGWGAREIKWHRYITNTIVFLLIALLLIQPIRAGRDTARNYIPSIDDAWWDSLSKIDREAAPDAIISSWWDFGHWFKYVADRRVLADGTTQHTHVPRWLGLSLVSPSEDESIGVLRMLSCGSDAYPAAEGQFGAYGRVLNKTNDPIISQQIVREIAVLSRDDAREHLAQRGFSAAEQDGVLNVSHCNPPEHYFITSGDMIGKAGVWAHFGLWNFTKAYIVQHSRNLPHDEAVADLQERFGMSAQEAEQLYYEAKRLTTEGEFNQFAAPWPGYITGGWMPCSTARDNASLVCPLSVGLSQNGNSITAIDGFIYNASDPNQSRLQYGMYQNGRRVQGNNNVTPGLMVLALQDRMEDVRFSDAGSPGMAIVVDVPNRRVLLADPLLAKSMFTQLYYLDGRYSHHFKKFEDRTTFTGSRVIIWKVDWNGTAPNATNTTRASNATSTTRNTTR